MEEQLCECGAPLIWIADQSVTPPWVDSRAKPSVLDPADYTLLEKRDFGKKHWKHIPKGIPCVVRQGFNRVKRFSLLPVAYSQKMHAILSKLSDLNPAVKVEVILDRQAKGLAYLMFVSEVVAVRLHMKEEDVLRKSDVMEIVNDLLGLTNLSQDDMDIEFVKILLEFGE